MLKRHFLKPLLLLTILCAIPTTGFIAGCGGGSAGPTLPNPVAPNPSLVGAYEGTYTITSGTDVGESGPFTLNVASNGRIQATSGLGNDTINYAGVITTYGGEFRLLDITENKSITITGTLGGTITFVSSRADNNAGTITVTKTISAL